MWLATAAALGAGFLLAWSYLNTPTEPGAPALLTKASAVAASTDGTLLWTSGKYQFARPAVLEAGSSEVRFQRVQALFIKANYSWEDPMSARSFTAWRHQLPEKKDYVTSVQEVSGRRFYRVRTSTESGILRTASLTLRADTYRPTHARFEFLGEEPMEVSEQAETPKNSPQEVQSTPLIQLKAVEKQASPEDELRVFAALDSIGADAEEPIDVKLDAEHHAVLVTGMGMPPARQKQIQTALGILPNTIVRFSAGPSLGRDLHRVTPPDAFQEDSGQAFRQRLQDHAGGARQLQNITDAALDTCNALFAQAHSLLVLSHEFPPLIEESLSPASANTLLSLRQRHVGAMAYALRQLKETLKPLSGEDASVDSVGDNSKTLAWQSGGEALFESTRNLDRLMSRLLAGSYSEQAGEEMLKQLPKQLSSVESLLRAQSSSESK